MCKELLSLAESTSMPRTPEPMSGPVFVLLCKSRETEEAVGADIAVHMKNMLEDIHSISG